MVHTPITSSNLYPDSDGQPMADNTLQYQWIVRLVENLKHLLAGQNAFAAGDLLWYPVEVERGQKVPVQAPDAMVVFGRPEQYRGSYQQWKEDNIAPQVVFEILSPSNSGSEMVAKQSFYAEHGVLEMYFYDPDSHNFWGFARTNQADELTTIITALHLPWVSPLLKIRFELFEDGLEISYPNGEPFKTFTELAQEREQLQSERDQAQQAQAQTQAKLDQAIAQLRKLGIDPESLR